MDSGCRSQVEDDFAELAERFNELESDIGLDKATVRGSLSFTAQYSDVAIADSFVIEITISRDYPSVLPTIRECGGRIPKEFHTYEDGALCLAAPLDLKMKFDANPHLLGYVTDLVIPYLFSFSYWSKHGVMPYGELPHGGEGILESYRELFGVDSNSVAICLLLVLATGGYRGHHECPCGSGLQLRKCHGATLRQVSDHRGSAEFLGDLVHCTAHLRKCGEPIPEAILNERVLQLMRQNIGITANQSHDSDTSTKHKSDIGGHHEHRS